MRYFFLIDAQGRPIAGTALETDEPPAEYPVEGTEYVWLNQHKIIFNEQTQEWEDDPNYVPPVPVTPPEPLDKKLARLEAENETLKGRLSQMDSDLAGFIDQYYVDNPDKA